LYIQNLSSKARMTSNHLRRNLSCWIRKRNTPTEARRVYSEMKNMSAMTPLVFPEGTIVLPNEHYRSVASRDKPRLRFLKQDVDAKLIFVLELPRTPTPPLPSKNPLSGKTRGCLRFIVRKAAKNSPNRVMRTERGKSGRTIPCCCRSTLTAFFRRSIQEGFRPSRIISSRQRIMGTGDPTSSTKMEENTRWITLACT
jgi:hypothetical protein